MFKTIESKKDEESRDDVAGSGQGCWRRGFPWNLHDGFDHRVLQPYMHENDRFPHGT